MLDATIEEIELNGVPGVRIERVLELTGASFSSLYHHFTSRDGLITAALLESIEHAVFADLEQTGQLVAQATTPNEFLHAFETIFRALVSPDAALVRARRVRALAASETLPELRAAIIRSQIETAKRASEIFKNAQNSGILDSKLDSEALGWFAQQQVAGLSVTDLNLEEINSEVLVQTNVDALRGVFHFAMR